MTAGHDALRGSGAGQNRAFKDTVALMDCPDRRIDWLSITCCSVPSGGAVPEFGPVLKTLMISQGAH
jgi:hypothetical protein